MQGYHRYMASIAIRRLADSVKARLRIRAELTRKRAQGLNLAEIIRRHIEPPGGVELKLPKRERVRRPPQFV